MIRFVFREREAKRGQRPSIESDLGQMFRGCRQVCEYARYIRADDDGWLIINLNRKNTLLRRAGVIPFHTEPLGIGSMQTSPTVFSCVVASPGLRAANKGFRRRIVPVR